MLVSNISKSCYFFSINTKLEELYILLSVNSIVLSNFEKEIKSNVRKCFIFLDFSESNYHVSCVHLKLLKHHKHLENASL